MIGFISINYQGLSEVFAGLLRTRLSQRLFLSSRPITSERRFDNLPVCGLSGRMLLLASNRLVALATTMQVAAYTLSYVTE